MVYFDRRTQNYYNFAVQPQPLQIDLEVPVHFTNNILLHDIMIYENW